MRLVIQRVSNAQVEVNDSIVGKITAGLLILIAFEKQEDHEDVEWVINKIVNLRIFDDNKGVMNLSINDVKADILLVSQFTLYAQVKKGNRPSYNRAALPELAVKWYEEFKKNLSDKLLGNVESGVFGAHMKVTLINDGPVTIIIDSKNRE